MIRTFISRGHVIHLVDPGANKARCKSGPLTCWTILRRTDLFDKRTRVCKVCLP